MSTPTSSGTERRSASHRHEHDDETTRTCCRPDANACCDGTPWICGQEESGGSRLVSTDEATHKKQHQFLQFVNRTILKLKSTKVSVHIHSKRNSPRSSHTTLSSVTLPSAFVSTRHAHRLPAEHLVTLFSCTSSYGVWTERSIEQDCCGRGVANAHDNQFRGKATLVVK